MGCLSWRGYIRRGEVDNIVLKMGEQNEVGGTVTVTMEDILRDPNHTKIVSVQWYASGHLRLFDFATGNNRL